MDNPRTYGKAPYRVAVVHGGPGARGDVAGLARVLGEDRGVLEPLQFATTLDGQVEELADLLMSAADGPVALIGHSWGAWLGLFVAAEHPELVERVILVGSGPFEPGSGDGIRQARLERLTESERREVERARDIRDGRAEGDPDAALARIGELYGRADQYDAVQESHELLDVDVDGFTDVWRRAAEMRESGELLDVVATVESPVVALHGAYDPHPAEGVTEPLESVLDDFRYRIFDKCGHRPWAERHARQAFLRELRNELNRVDEG